MDITLVNPPSPFLKDQLVMPPLGLMYLLSYLKSKLNDSQVRIHDCAVTDKPIPHSNITAFTSTTPQYPYALELLSKTHDTLKVIGGAHASCFGNCLSEGFDVQITGEGEMALYQTTNLKKAKNVLIHGKHIENLDILPFPDREWDGFKKYKYLVNDYSFTTAMTSRGCPYRCGFCYSIFGQKVRFMSPERVLKEAKLIKELGYDGVMYYDDTFTLDKERVKKISSGLSELDLKFRCFIRANTVSYDILKTLKDNGCVEVGMGVESGSQKILNIINKKLIISQCKKVIQDCHKIGLRIKIFLMIGLPGESHSTVNETKSFIKETKPDDYDITIYTPFPNTPIWDNKKSLDIKFKLPIDYKNLFYKSFQGSYISNVETLNLSYGDIEILRDEIDNLKKDLYE